MEMALQPIVDLRSGRVVGVESLARFSDHRPPDAHFAEADVKGRRVALELRAVRAGLARIGELPRDAYLTVNVSPDTAVSSRLARILADAPAERVVLELTEHAPVGDYSELAAALGGLRERGLRIAVDDAGAGFASMRHVLALRPEVIKLDVSIIRGIDADPQRREFVRALVQFARATRCTLVAEGIETRVELAQVRALGVSCGQGFWLGRPARGSAGPWHLALPKVRRRRLPGPDGRFGRVGRPASVLLAAAMAWPTIVAAAGLKTPSAGETQRRAPAAETRRTDGDSSLPPAYASGPAAAQPAAARSRPVAPVERAVTAKPPAGPEPAESAPEPKVVANTVEALGGVVGGVVDTAQGTVSRVTRLLGGLLGGRTKR